MSCQVWASEDAWTAAELAINEEAVGFGLRESAHSNRARRQAGRAGASPESSWPGGAGGGAQPHGTRTAQGDRGRGHCRGSSTGKQNRHGTPLRQELDDPHCYRPYGQPQQRPR
ncbi:hypothetical protein HaLaN_27718 [Haematococcus lacustris]|uniref:Uncharacterized protein n=1 Tax=Haematococcus lacustris TaxID=44745 RepID=A0A6A0A9M6_HAELA|nr:hypothetical protein HaLaN_27718 [Haematococcus lacustris]